MSHKQPHLRKTLNIVFLILVTAVAAYFRFVNLAQNPGIYNDEGTLLNISINLYHGRAEYLGIQGSWLLAGRMPLFPWLLSLSYRIFEPDLWVLRLFTASSGVLSVILLFFFLKSISDPQILYLTYATPLILALHPKFVLFNRIGFGYNLLIPVTIVVIWFIWLYIESKKDMWLVLASIIAGTGLLIELAYVSFLVFLYLAVAFASLRKLPYFILLSLTPLLAYFAVSYLIYGDSFLFDWQVTFGRGTSYPVLYQIANIILNFINFIFEDIFALISIFGIISLPNRRIRLLIFFGILIPLIMITRTFSVSRHSFYYILPYIPFIAIGIGNGFIQISKWILIFSKESLPLQLSNWGLKSVQRMIEILLFDLILFFTIIAPASLIILNLNQQVNSTLQTPIQDLFIEYEELNQIVDSLRKTTSQTDLIIASPALAWAIPSNATDYQISIAVNESPTIHFPQGIPRERMRFESSIKKADYVIIDPIMRSWKSYEIPGIEEWIDKIEAEWFHVMQTKTISVFRNPAH